MEWTPLPTASRCAKLAVVSTPREERDVGPSYHDRDRSCEEQLSTARRVGRRIGGVPQEAEPGESIGISSFSAELRGGDGGLRRRSLLGPVDRRLARPGAAPALDRRQAAVGQDIEDGPARSQASADHGCHGGRPLGGPAPQEERSVARQDAGAQAEDAGRRGVGQPDGAHRLGADDQEGELPSSRRRLMGGQAGSCRKRGQV